MLSLQELGIDSVAAENWLRGSNARPQEGLALSKPT